MKSIKLAILCLMVVMFVSTALSSKQNTHNQHPGMFKYIKDSKVQENKLPGDVYDNLDEMVSWFIKGTGANLIVNNTFEDFARAIDNSIQDFTSKGFTMDTYLTLTRHIGAAQPMITFCFNSSYDGYKDAAAHISTFSSPKDYFTKMGLKVAYSFFDWYRIYYSMTNAISKQNMTYVSFLSGQIVKTMLDFNSKLNQTDLTTTQLNADSIVESIFELIYGVLDGAIFSKSDKIEVCETTTTDYVAQFETAMTEFKKHTEEGLYQGVNAVSQLFGQLYNLNNNCYGAYNSAISRINEYIEIFSSPYRIFFNLIWGYKAITTHMIDGMECLYNYDAKCVGSHLGNLFYLSFSKTK